MKINVAIVEDDREWLNCMVEFLNLQEDLSIAGTAVSSEEAIHLAKTVSTDIILMDINLSENKYDGIYCTAEISQFSKAKIIMLTGLQDEDVMIQSFTAGAVNYILKENFLDIPNVIRTIHYGGSPVEVLARNFAKLQEEKMLGVLTPSEKEVFDYISNGYNLPQIAEKQFKTLGTLKCQVNKILKKLRARNSREAIRKVKMRGVEVEFGG